MHSRVDKATTERWTRRLLTVTEAAEELGLTVEAVRSRLKRGTLEKEKAHDGSVFVVVEAGQDAQARPGEAHDRPGEDQDNDWAHAQTLIIGRLESEVEFLREELRSAHEQARRKDHIIAALTEHIPELEAVYTPSQKPENGPESASEEPSMGEAPEKQKEPKKRPWWRRLIPVMPPG